MFAGGQKGWRLGRNSWLEQDIRARRPNSQIITINPKHTITSNNHNNHNNHNH